VATRREDRRAQGRRRRGKPGKEGGGTERGAGEDTARTDNSRRAVARYGQRHEEDEFRGRSNDARRGNRPPPRTRVATS